MFKAALAPVSNRGVPPQDFLDRVLSFCKSAPDEIFAPNSATNDVYAKLRPVLAPKGWAFKEPVVGALVVRRAAMAEAMRVHAGLESSWNWNEGVDKSNSASQAHITGQESGIFQVSFDSEWLDPSLRAYTLAHGIDTPMAFIDVMKQDRSMAIEYYARLVRITTRWAGPYNSGEVQQLVSRAALAEWIDLLVG